MTQRKTPWALQSQGMMYPLGAAANRSAGQYQASTMQGVSQAIQGYQKTVRYDEQMQDMAQHRRAALHLKNLEFEAEANRHERLQALQMQQLALKAQAIDVQERDFMFRKQSTEQKRQDSMLGEVILDKNAEKGKQFGVYTRGGPQYFEDINELHEYVKVAHPDKYYRSKNLQQQTKHMEMLDQFRQEEMGLKERQTAVQEGELDIEQRRQAQYEADPSLLRRNMFGSQMAQGIGRVAKTESDIGNYHNQQVEQLLEKYGYTQDDWANKTEKVRGLDESGTRTVMKQRIPDEDIEKITEQMNFIQTAWAEYQKALEKVKDQSIRKKK